MSRLRLLESMEVPTRAAKGMIMGKSFFNGNYTQLYTGSAMFSELISSDPSSYGLPALQASAYAALHDIYAEKYLAAANRDDRSPAKTRARNDAAIPLKAMAVSLASIINGTPTVTNEQKLALGLSVRNDPTPVTELGTPHTFKAELGGDGSLLIKWQCASPRARGMTYQIWRRIGAEGEYVYLAGTSAKKFTDASIPGGTQQVMYRIRATRSTGTGGWANFTVAFSASTSGAVSASAQQAKLAA